MSMTHKEPDAIYQAGYDEGFQNGREQERALWELSAMGQEESVLSAAQACGRGYGKESRPAVEPGVLREALEAIQRWGLDTLSGRANGLPADVEWHRVGIREMTRRATAALATIEKPTAQAAIAEPAGENVLTPPHHPEPHSMTWTSLERASIRAYGERCWCAGRSTGLGATASTERPALSDAQIDQGLDDDVSRKDALNAPSQAPAAIRLAEQVLSMDLVTPRGLRAREIAREVLACHDDLLHALHLIEHATASTPDDGGSHEAAHDVALGAIDRATRALAAQQAQTKEPK